MGLDFEQRWRRLDDAIATMRALWRTGSHDGPFYSTAGVDLAPRPVQPGGPPLWVGSWGSTRGLRRVARLADGWLASAYHLTPAGITEARGRLDDELTRAGRDPSTFPDAVATLFFQVTDDAAEAESLITDVLAPALNRPPHLLTERLAIGPATLLGERLAALRGAGVQCVYLWPVLDPLRQVELLAEVSSPPGAPATSTRCPGGRG